MSSLRAAKNYGQRPTAMLTHNPYALKDHWWEPKWKPDDSSRDWTDWDYALADAFQVIQDYTDDESGQYIPIDQSGDVWWDPKISESGYLKAVDEYRDKHELKPGERVYAVPVFDSDKPKPTLGSWLKDQEEGITDRVPSEHKGARPPTAKELAAMNHNRTDRIER